MEHDDRKGRIRTEEEAIHRNEMRPLPRRDLSLSVHSGRGRVVVPENVLPITYKTL